MGLIKPNDSCTKLDKTPVEHLLWITRLCSKSIFSEGLYWMKIVGASVLLKSPKHLWTADKNNKEIAASTDSWELCLV